MEKESEIIFTLPELREKLLNKTVTQTIRSRTELTKHNFTVGSNVSVKWKNDFLGRARIVRVEPVRIRELTIEDARLGGFDSVDKLIKALKRFFGRLGKERFWVHEVNRVRFQWI